MLKFRSYCIKTVLLIVCLFCFPQNSNAEVFPVNQVQLDFDGREWVADYVNISDDGQINEFVLKGESVDDWSELVTVNTYVIKSTTEMFEFLQTYYYENAVKSNADFKWEEIYKDENKVIKEFYVKPYGHITEGEHTLCLFLKGEEGLHFVLYASHDEAEFLKHKQSWIESFKNVKVFIPVEKNKNLNEPLLSDPDKMIHIKYRYTGEAIQKNRRTNLFALKSRELWRSGENYCRGEEQLNVEDELQLLNVLNNLDMWKVNLFNKRGQHIAIPKSYLSTIIPVFDEEKQNGLNNFEFGQEQTFFKHYGARQLKDEIIDTHDCNVFELTRLYWVLKLYVRKDTNLPYLVSRKGPDKSTMSVYYETYKSNLNFDSTLFTKPDGISWQ